ncbi:AMP-binding protein, partial [bacterium]|nr:AMP-binding protein [bacterium]
MGGDKYRPAYEFAGKLIPQLVEESARRDPERPALMVHRGGGKVDKISYAQLWDKVVRLSSFIQKAGINPGEHIALLGTNSPEWATAYLAIQSAGCVVVPLDSAQRPQELRHIIRHSDSVAIFLAKRFEEVLTEDGEDAFPEMSKFFLENIDALIKTETKPVPVRFPESDDATAVIIYTSGTTGSPKGVVLSHKNIVSDIEGMVPRFPFTTRDNFLSVLPVHHAFEATAGFLTPLAIGCGIGYARALRAKEILEDIQAYDATIMLGVPLLFEKFHRGILKGVEQKGRMAKTVFSSLMGFTKLIDSALKIRSGAKIFKKFRQKAGFGNMWLMISGGAAINPETVRFFNHFGVVFCQGYGLTETAPVLTVNPPDRNKPESVGPPIGGAEIKIDSPNSEGVGEILARGPMVFKEYYKNPEATEKALTPDGWFRTGDLGRLDEDGYLYIVGRAKNLIVTAGGKNLYPEEIEEKLNDSPYILESLVIGVKKKG